MRPSDNRPFFYCPKCLYNYGNEDTCGSDLRSDEGEVDYLVLMGSVNNIPLTQRSTFLRLMIDTTTLQAARTHLGRMGALDVRYLVEFKLDRRRRLDIGMLLKPTTKILVIGKGWWDYLRTNPGYLVATQHPSYTKGMVSFNGQPTPHFVSTALTELQHNAIGAVDAAIREFSMECRYAERGQAQQSA